MQIDKATLLSAASKLGIPDQKAEELWNALGEKASHDVSKLDLSRLLYYFGAMIVIIAMGWFVNEAWERFGGGGMLAIAVAYMLVFIFIGSVLWRKEDLQVPGGLFITMAVCLIPLAVYGFQKWTGWWVVDAPGQYSDFFSWVSGSWFFMEACTIIGGCIALKFFRFPFLTAPLFFALWFMSMDVTPLIFGNSENLWDDRLWVSIGFGIVLLIVAYVTDLTTKEDFAFWGYLFGVITFWTGLSILDSTSELDKFFYFLINIGLMLLSVVLQRSVFLVFGSIGVLIYTTSLFYRYFSNSVLFPVVLSLIGVLVVFAGMIYHKNRQRIDSFILNLFPSRVQQWLPKPKK